MSIQKQPKTFTVQGPDESFTGDGYFNTYYSGEPTLHVTVRPRRRAAVR
ncbi:hypothetical protein [Nesterenkonia pannonica]|nr:hypothetical protein [Nesterenkonia pannonica]